MEKTSKTVAKKNGTFFRAIFKLGLSLGLFLALSAGAAFAIAPTGTMTMTSQSIATSATEVANNTITVTAANTEILATTDVHIKIPSAINARWNPANTSATYVFSGAGAANATVTISGDGKTATIDITTNLGAADNIQISGLGFLGDAASASGALVWAVDNATVGSATFSSTSGAALTVTVTDAGGVLTMTNATAGSNGTATLTFTVSVAMAVNDTVTFTAPAELDVSNLSTTAVTGTLDGTTGVVTCTAVAQAVTCTLTTVGDHAAGAGLTIIFPASAVRGAYVAGTGNIADLAVNDVSATPAGADINSDATVATPAITIGDLTTTNVAPESLSLSTISPTTFTFTTTAAVPTGAKIVVVYPAGWDLAGAAGQVGSALSGLTGTWTATVSGQTLTLTKSGGSLDVAGAKSLTLNGIMTPSNEGSGGTYSVTTRTTADANIEIDAAVTADTIIGKVASSIVVGSPTSVKVTDNTGGGVLITWVDPSGTSDATKDIKIMKGTAPLPVDGAQYALVLKGVQKYVDTNVKVGDTVTYQLRASNGSGETGTTTAAVSFVVGSTITTTGTGTTGTTGTTEDTTDTTGTTGDTTGTTGDTTGTTGDTTGTTGDTTGTTGNTTGTTGDTTGDDTGVSTEVKLTDIATHWAKTEIMAMVEAGIIKGYPDGTFKPNDNLNRAESGILLCRALGIDETEAAESNPFTDVKKDSWYGGCVAELKAIKVVKGNPDGTYKPISNINRAEFTALVMRAYGEMLDEEEKADLDALLNAKTPKTSFVDVKTTDWYANVASAAMDKGFVKGRACGKDNKDKCFDGGTSITRAEATVVLFRAFADLL